MEDYNKLELIGKKLDIKKKRLEIADSKKEAARSDARMIMDQISQLRGLLTERIIDSEATIFPTETKYKNVLEPHEIKIVKTKIMNLMSKF